MEILHRGTPPSEREYRGSCTNCKTVIKFKANEAKRHSDQRDGDFLSIGCPICNGTIYVNYSNYIKPPSVDPY